MTNTTSRIESNLLPDSVNLVQDLLQDILQTMSQVNQEDLGHIFHWNNLVSRLSCDISTFVEITTLLSKMLFKQTGVVIPGVKESHIHLLFIMKALNQASQKQDLMVLEELIKYELKDNLTQWKISLIPLMKKHLNI